MNYVQRMLGEHERVVFTTHQHWVVLANSFLVNFALALLIIFVAGIVWIPLMFPLGWAAALLVIIPFARFIYHFLVWENREYLITNRRVIQISGVLNKNVFDSSLEKVNDVKMSQSFVGRILDYGDVEIMTAAEEGENLFRRIQGPLKFKTAMLNQKEAMGSDEVIAGRGPRTPDVPTLIENLAQLRKQGLITEEEYQSKKQELLGRI
jgi:uncharacterized membrane protein YdbT with pleckstrin-like domain